MRATGAVRLYPAAPSWARNKDDPQTEIEEATLAPTHYLESAIVTTLPSGPYTAVIRERTGQNGIGLVEVYNLQDP